MALLQCRALKSSLGAQLHHHWSQASCVNVGCFFRAGRHGCPVTDKLSSEAQNRYEAPPCWPGTERCPQTAQPRVGRQCWGRSHKAPLTWNGLVAEGVSAEALVMWQTPEHLGEKGGPGCPGKSQKSNFFLLFLWPGISLDIYNFLTFKYCLDKYCRKIRRSGHFEDLFYFPGSNFRLVRFFSQNICNSLQLQFLSLSF